MTTMTNDKMTTIGKYFLVVTPWTRSLDGKKTFSVRVYDNEQEANNGANVIAYVSDTLRTLDACNGDRAAARFAAFKSNHSVKSILKAARALV